jgi:hypothetical protein
MNLELLEPAIAPHIAGTRQGCASLSVRLISGSFAMLPFTTAAFVLDPRQAITQFVCEPGNLDPASSIRVRVGTIPIYLDLPTGGPKGLCRGRDCQTG